MPEADAANKRPGEVGGHDPLSRDHRDSTRPEILAVAGAPLPTAAIPMNTILVAETSSPGQAMR